MTSDRNTEAVHCPLCGASVVDALKIGIHRIVDCTDCGHRFVATPPSDDHVALVYGDGYFFGGGDGYDDYTKESALLMAQGRRYGALLVEHARPGRLLDVGCAAGFVTRGMADAGWEVTGLEPNGTMATYGRQVLGLNILEGTLENVVDKEPFDAVCLVQVIGHFHDLRRCFKQISALTRPGGLCLVEYWRRESAIARILGARWHEYSPPSVLHWFTRGSLDRAFGDRGFDRVASGAPKKYISGGHAASLLAHKLSGVPGHSMLTAPLGSRLADMKLPYPPLDLEWRLYRRT